MVAKYRGIPSTWPTGLCTYGTIWVRGGWLQPASPASASDAANNFKKSRRSSDATSVSPGCSERSHARKPSESASSSSARQKRGPRWSASFARIAAGSTRSAMKALPFKGRVEWRWVVAGAFGAVVADSTHPPPGLPLEGGGEELVASLHRPSSERGRSSEFFSGGVIGDMSSNP